MQQSGKTKAHAAAKEGHEVPDVAKLRESMTLKLLRLITETRATWKTCARKDCRRQRVCTAPNFQCINMPPAPKLTKEQEAAAMAKVKKALERRLAEIGKPPRE